MSPDFTHQIFFSSWLTFFLYGDRIKYLLCIWQCSRLYSAYLTRDEYCVVIYYYTVFFYRRNIKTEEKAKVVVAVWGIELNQSIAALVTYFVSGWFEEGNAFILFFLSFSCNSFYLPNQQNSYSIVRQWIDSAPQTAATAFAFSSVFILLLCVYFALAIWGVKNRIRLRRN